MTSVSFAAVTRRSTPRPPLWLGLALGAIVGCRPEVCAPPTNECPGELGCVVGQCRGKEGVVAVETRRVVLHAREVRVLSSRDPSREDVVALGAEAGGDVAVLMKFDAGVGRGVTIEGAFLVLEPELESPGPARAVQVAVAPILADWSPESASWGRLPPLGGALGQVAVPPARRAPLRFDVTALVAKRAGAGSGLALTAVGDDPVGARFITRARSTEGPKLELYLR